MSNSLVFVIHNRQRELHRLEQLMRLRMLTFDWDTATTEDRLSLAAQSDLAQDLRDEIDGLIRLLNEQ